MTFAIRALTAVAIVLSTGCAFNSPNILSESPYNEVKYTSAPTAQMKKISSVAVTTRGYEANIRHSIPALYKKALELKGRAPASEGDALYVSNIGTSVHTKVEPFEQSYQDCHNERRGENVPYQTCQSVRGYNGYTTQSCTTNYRYEYRDHQVCVTKYRTVNATVMYQDASADVYAGPKQ